MIKYVIASGAGDVKSVATQTEKEKKDPATLKAGDWVTIGKLVPILQVCYAKNWSIPFPNKGAFCAFLFPLPLLHRLPVTVICLGSPASALTGFFTPIGLAEYLNSCA